MQNCSFSGAITRPEVKTSKNGKKYAKLSISDTVYRKDEDPYTRWIPLLAFGKTAEIVEKYLDKGCKISVKANVDCKVNEYNGKKYENISVVIETMEIHTFKNDSTYGNTEENTEEKKDEYDGVNPYENPFDDIDDIPFTE